MDGILTTALSAWRPGTPVTVITPDRLAAALDSRPDPADALTEAGVIFDGLVESYQLDQAEAAAAFWPDILAAVVVSMHEQQPTIVAGQADRIRYFLSHEPVRRRLGGRNRPALPELPANVTGFNPDGTYIHGD
jgi:hypothetical protein